MNPLFSLKILTFITLTIATSNLQADQLKYDPFAKEKEVVIVGETTVTTSNPVEKTVQESWDEKLLSIIEAGSDSIANVDGNFIALGESYKKYTLVKVNKSSVVFEKDSHEIKLELEE